MVYYDYNLEEYIQGRENPKRPFIERRIDASRGQKLCVEAIGDIMQQLTSGLAFLHSHEIIYRNLKPRNGKFDLSVNRIMF